MRHFKVTYLFAGLNIIINQLIFHRRLKIALPSLSFSMFPFSFEKNGHIKIGKRAILAEHSEIISWGDIEIGENLSLNKYSRIVGLEKIKIGNNVTVAQFVSILDHDHSYELTQEEMILKGYNTKGITIGNNVWIGDKVTICKGVSIGSNVIIGANSLVNKDIENNCVAAGVPCRKIREI